MELGLKQGAIGGQSIQHGGGPVDNSQHLLRPNADFPGNLEKKGGQGVQLSCLGGVVESGRS